MKPSRIVWMFWLGNVVALGAVATFMWFESNSTRADRDARYAAVADIDTREPRIHWQPDVERAPFEMVDTRLSPIERPRAPEPPKPVVIEPPPPEKTDDQLRDALELALNKRFKLLRMMLSSSEEYPNVALVVGDGARMLWLEDTDLNEYSSKSPALRKLACDVKVLTIDELGVLVDAASFEKPGKRFEILLKLNEEPLSLTMSGAQFQPDGEALKPIGKKKDDILDRGFQPGAEPLPPDDKKQEVEKFDDQAIDDFAKYTKSTEHGLQILPELPEDSPARKYGARGGEIIKTINGEDVKTMSDVRRVVRTQYDAGTREFNVGYERDGVPGVRILKAPAEK